MKKSIFSNLYKFEKEGVEMGLSHLNRPGEAVENFTDSGTGNIIIVVKASKPG